MTVTYTCQGDHCGKVGTNSADFKRVVYRGAIGFTFVLCNECAKRYERKESNV